MTRGSFRRELAATARLAGPLIGGFVGSDALACLIHYGFDRAPGPMVAIDLGTNGEVMVTDGERILCATMSEQDDGWKIKEVSSRF